MKWRITAARGKQPVSYADGTPSCILLPCSPTCTPHCTPAYTPLVLPAVGTPLCTPRSTEGITGGVHTGIATAGEEQPPVTPVEKMLKRKWFVNQSKRALIRTEKLTEILFGTVFAMPPVFLNRQMVGENTVKLFWNITRLQIPYSKTWKSRQRKHLHQDTVGT